MHHSLLRCSRERRSREGGREGGREKEREIPPLLVTRGSRRVPEEVPGAQGAGGAENERILSIIGFDSGKAAPLIRVPEFDRGKAAPRT